MGIDIFDINFRIERSFGVRPSGDDYVPYMIKRTPPDLTAGELHDLVAHLCLAADKPVPYSSWTRIKLVLVAALGVKPSEVRKKSLLIRELGMD